MKLSEFRTLQETVSLPVNNFSATPAQSFSSSSEDITHGKMSFRFFLYVQRPTSLKALKLQYQSTTPDQLRPKKEVKKNWHQRIV